MDKENGIEGVAGQLRHQELFHKSVVDSIPVAVFCKDAMDEYRFTVWNRKQEEITGIKSEEAIGKTDFDLFPEQAATEFRTMDEEVMSKGDLVDIVEEKIESPVMGTIWVHTQKAVVCDGDGNDRWLLGVVEDITSKKQASAELHRTSEELQATQLQLIQAEKMESIGRLAAGVAHEVKNPLALMLMGLDYLDGGVDTEDPNLPVVLSEMREAIGRADQIVRGLVDFSAERRLDLAETDLVPVVEQGLLFVRHELTKASVTVVREFETELPQVVLDTAKFEQVLVNVLMNAIHAIEACEIGSERELEIRIKRNVAGKMEKNEGKRSGAHLREGDEVVEIRLRDSGSGLPEDKSCEVFEPFFTTKAAGSGTGLGLSVVRKILSLHGGMVSLGNRDDGRTGADLLIHLRPVVEDQD